MFTSFRSIPSFPSKVGLFKRRTRSALITAATATALVSGVQSSAQTIGDQLMRGVLGSVQKQINGTPQPLPPGMSAGPAPQAPSVSVLWPDKATFLNAARLGELSRISRVIAAPQSPDATAVVESIGQLLAREYQVPGLPRSAQGCVQQFRQNVLSLMDTVTRVHVDTLNDVPPDFYQDARQTGRTPQSVVNEINAGPNCDFEVLGLRKSHPYKAALISLLGEYGEATRAYVDAERANKQAVYRAALQQSAPAPRPVVEAPQREPQPVLAPPAASKRREAERAPAKRAPLADNEVQI